jgi:hypothetical protein
MVNAENSLHAVKSLHAECQTLEHIITTQLQSIQKDEGYWAISLLLLFIIN